MSKSVRQEPLPLMPSASFVLLDVIAYLIITFRVAGATFNTFDL